MTQAASILSLLEDLDSSCPGGYAVALHIKFTTPTYLFQTYPADWNTYYTQNGLVMQDPTVHWGFANVGIKPWGELIDQDESGILAKAAEFGLLHGFTYATDAHASRSVTSFARQDRQYTPDEMERISQTIDALHASTTSDVALSSEDRATLRLKSLVLPG